MQRCLIYEKAMAADTKNGGSSLNNNNCKDHSRRMLLVGVDLFCLFLGKSPKNHFSRVTLLWGRLAGSLRLLARFIVTSGVFQRDRVWLPRLPNSFDVVTLAFFKRKVVFYCTFHSRRFSI